MQGTIEQSLKLSHRSPPNNHQNWYKATKRTKQIDFWFIDFKLNIYLTKFQVYWFIFSEQLYFHPNRNKVTGNEFSDFWIFDYANLRQASSRRKMMSFLNSLHISHHLSANKSELRASEPRPIRGELVSARVRGRAPGGRGGCGSHLPSPEAARSHSDSGVRPRSLSDWPQV